MAPQVVVGRTLRITSFVTPDRTTSLNTSSSSSSAADWASDSDSSSSALPNGEDPSAFAIGGGRSCRCSRRYSKVARSDASERKGVNHIKAARSDFLGQSYPFALQPKFSSCVALQTRIRVSHYESRQATARECQPCRRFPRRARGMCRAIWRRSQTLQGRQNEH